MLDEGVRRERPIGKINTRSRSAQRSSLRSMPSEEAEEFTPRSVDEETLRSMGSTPRFATITASRRARSLFGWRRGRPAPAPG